MKLIIIISLTFTALIGCKEKQPSNKNPARLFDKKDTMNLIKNIQHYKLKIDSIQPSLDSIKSHVYNSAEGGIIKSFYNRSDTLKKEIIYYGETGKRFIHIYVKGEKTVLINDIIFFYNKSLTLENGVKIDSISKNSYYFNDSSNLIYWVRDGKAMPPSRYLEQKNLLYYDN